MELLTAGRGRSLARRPSRLEQRDAVLGDALFNAPVSLTTEVAAVVHVIEKNI
jgi:hypothetical protein